MLIVSSQHQSRILAAEFLLGSLVGLGACGIEEFHHGPSSDAVTEECPVDRDATCLLGDNSACEGYPSPGADGYGDAEGERLGNFVLQDCDGNTHEFAEFLRKDEGPFCGYDGAILIAFGADWCESCKVESSFIHERYEEWNRLGVSALNIVLGSNDSEPATEALCRDWANQGWKSSSEEEPLAFSVWYDPRGSPSSYETLKRKQGDLPLTALVDANANIRRIFGEIPDEDYDRELDRVLRSPYGEEP